MKWLSFLSGGFAPLAIPFHAAPRPRTKPRAIRSHMKYSTIRQREQLVLRS